MRFPKAKVKIPATVQEEKHYFSAKSPFNHWSITHISKKGPTLWWLQQMPTSYVKLRFLTIAAQSSLVLYADPKCSWGC